jgi:hypothetical protein
MIFLYIFYIKILFFNNSWRISEENREENNN